MLFCVAVCIGFVRTQNNEQHHEQVQIRFWTDMLGDILQNSVYPGGSKGNLNGMIL